MNQLKTLVASPIHQIKSYCLYDWIAVTKNLFYKNYDLYLVDNSPNFKFHQEIRSLGVNVDWVSPEGKSSRQYMCECNELIREKALNGKYKYLLHNECDLPMPPDTIETLMAHKKPVVGLTYHIYTGELSEPMLQEIESMPVGNSIETRNLGVQEAFIEFDGKLKRIYACGLGCVLIDVNVLKRIKFRVDNEDTAHADSFFYKDLYKLNIPVYVDTSITLDHYNQSWASIQDNYKELKK